MKSSASCDSEGEMPLVPSYRDSPSSPLLWKWGDFHRLGDLRDEDLDYPGEQNMSSPVLGSPAALPGSAGEGKKSQPDSPSQCLLPLSWTELLPQISIQKIFAMNNKQIVWKSQILSMLSIDIVIFTASARMCPKNLIFPTGGNMATSGSSSCHLQLFGISSLC